MTLFKQARRYGAQLAAGATTVALSAPSFAADPADALAAIGQVSTQSAGFGPPLFGLAVVAVGILIGVKWIKRARGAA